jgi:hypothetical protein
MTHVEEHLGAVAAARSHLQSKDGPPLGPLPAGFAATRRTLHAAAERLLKPKRELETGNEIALRFCEGGFGTPTWHRDEPGAEPGHVRIEGIELVLDEGGRETRVPLSEHAAAAQLLGVPEPEIPEPALDEAAAGALADWFAFGTVVLADLIERNPGGDPAAIRLWPEHFDVATELGSESAGTRANYGASPGDECHDEPYLYVGPWDRSVSGDAWNSTSFVGAELSHAQLRAAPDQLEAAVRFMQGRLDALG